MTDLYCIFYNKPRGLPKINRFCSDHIYDPFDIMTNNLPLYLQIVRYC
jgi:hypothetical protein